MRSSGHPSARRPGTMLRIWGFQTTLRGHRAARHRSAPATEWSGPMRTSTGQGHSLSAAALAEAVRRAAARKSSSESLAAVIEMAAASGPCDQASITMLGPKRSLNTVAVLERLDPSCRPAAVRAGRGAVPGCGLGRGPVRHSRTWSRTVGGHGGRRGPPNSASPACSSLHLFTDTALGSLNLYSLRPRDYDHGDIEAAG